MVSRKHNTRLQFRSLAFRPSVQADYHFQSIPLVCCLVRQITDGVDSQDFSVEGPQLILPAGLLECFLFPSLSRLSMWIDGSFSFFSLRLDEFRRLCEAWEGLQFHLFCDNDDAARDDDRCVGWEHCS